MFNDKGEDLGYQDDPQWWYKGPNRFRIANLDADYPEHYFTVAGVPQEVIDRYCLEVVNRYNLITGLELPNPGSFRSIAEFGAGGGWFAKKFEEMGIQGTVAYEGSIGGCHYMEHHGYDGFVQYDIREVHQPLVHKYPIALASEILEHCEPFFHGIAVYNLVGHSDLVWFSSEDPEVVHNPGHLHHPGEAPLDYWKALFNWHDYGCLMLPDSVYEATAGRGRCIFYNRQVHEENIQKYLQVYGE